MLDVDKLKLKGYTVNDYNQIKTLEFSYPYKDMIDILKDNNYPDVNEISELKNNKKNINIQFSLENEELEGVISLLVNGPCYIDSTIFDAELNYLGEQLDDLYEKINDIISNKAIMIETIDSLDSDKYKENDKFNKYLSGFEGTCDKYAIGKKAETLPNLDDYDGNYEDDYYEK